MIIAACNQCGAKGAGHTFDWNVNIPELKMLTVELVWEDSNHDYHLCLSCLLILLNTTIKEQQPSEIVFKE